MRKEARRKNIRLRSISPLLAELEDLKRQQPAHYDQSIASTLFAESWRRLMLGEGTENVAYLITTKALVSLLLPGCDQHFVHQSGLSRADTVDLYQKALHEVARERLEVDQHEMLERYIEPLMDEYFERIQEPNQDTPLKDFQIRAWFVRILSKQPRAGATSPGKARLLLLPPESHADHCLITAVMAVLLAPQYGASVAQPFLAGLSHHLHNAILPDCGFAGEELMQAYLPGIIRRGRHKALSGLPSELAEEVQAALAIHENLALPEGQTISAADVIDRVLDIKWRTRAAGVTNEDVLSELELVHQGPLKDFQDQLLEQSGIWQTY